MIQNKRSCERLKLDTPLRYKQKGSERFWDSISRDISDKGIGFISNEFFPVSTQLVFEIHQPKRQDVVKKIGEVRWISNERYSERFLVGARFITAAASAL